MGLKRKQWSKKELGGKKKIVYRGYNEENAQGLFSVMLIIQWIYPPLMLHFYIFMLVKTSDRPHNMLTSVCVWFCSFRKKSENAPGFISDEPPTKGKQLITLTGSCHCSSLQIDFTFHLLFLSHTILQLYWIIKVGLFSMPLKDYIFHHFSSLFPFIPLAVSVPVDIDCLN